MRNYDARMTGEVDKRFHEQRRNLLTAPENSVSDRCGCGIVCHLFGNSADLCTPPPNKLHPAAIQSGFHVRPLSRQSPSV